MPENSLSPRDTSFIDISLPLKEGVPVWPASTGIHLSWTLRVERGDMANLTRLDTDIHIGTHVEGVLHSLADGDPIDQTPLSIMVGRASVIYLPQVDAVMAHDLDRAKIAAGTTRLLIRTRNSEIWRKSEEGTFQDNFVGLTPDAAQWIIDKDIKLVGIDYLSIGRYGDGPVVHDILFKTGVIIIEGLNLMTAPAGDYKLICLPLKLIGREAAPARAVLIPLG